MFHFKKILAPVLIAFVFAAGGLKLSAQQTATIYLSPGSGSFAAGSSLTVRVMVNSGGGVGVNAAEAVLSFDPSFLSITRVSKDGSVFNLWTTEPTYSNAKGTIAFGGGAVPSAYTGSAGQVISATFQVLKEGTTRISFSSSQVLAADGKGTNVLGSANGGEYTLTAGTARPTPTPKKPTTTPTPVGKTPPAPEIKSKSHPDDDKWYQDATVELSWDLPVDVTGVAFALSETKECDPGTEKEENLVRTKTYKDAAQGKLNFCLRFQNEFGWGKVATRQILIDAAPPESFEIWLTSKNIYDNEPMLFFESQDKYSGIAYYEIRIGDGDAWQIEPIVAVHNPLKLPNQSPGLHPITVKAFDLAGNSSEAKIDLRVEARPVPPPPAPFFKRYSWLWQGLFILAVAGAAYYVYQLRKREEQLMAEMLNGQKKMAEIKERLTEVFSALAEETEEQVKIVDKRPRLSRLEKRVINKLEEAMHIAKDYLEKEIEEAKRILKK